MIFGAILSNPARLLTHYSRHCILILHAPPSKNMLPPLQHFVSFGRPRRCCCSILSAVDSLRSCVGHGDRSVHNSMPVGIPELGLASLGASVPGPDQFGFGQSLHAYVCHSNHGWIRTKSQKGGSEPESDSTSLLQQQGMCAMNLAKIMD